MKGIIPHLWLASDDRQAADFYTSLFDHSHITDTLILEDTQAPLISFELAGQPFMAIHVSEPDDSAEPYFKLNPSISLTVQCSSVEEINRLWDKLSDGGNSIMAIDEYPFSKRYGWVEDRYGVSWQLDLAEEAVRQKIVPTFLFSNAMAGKAEEALTFYTEIFPRSSVGDVYRDDTGETVGYAAFHLNDMQFIVMDNAMADLNEEEWSFNEAFSLIISCENQDEVDYYWNKLSAVPDSEQCGWLKDKYGVSWQVVPDILDKLMTTGTSEQIKNVSEAVLRMKKLDIAELEQAWEKGN